MKRYLIKAFFSLLLLAPFAAPASAAVNEKIIELAKPGGANLRYLFSVDDAASNDIGVILFAGAQGKVHLESGIPQPGANFLVRSRKLFALDGLAVAVYDPGSDIGPLSDATRMSAAHAAEVAQVLADFRQRSGAHKVYLVGTSRGTISAAYLANALKEQVDGVVLSSTLFSSSRAGPGLSGFDFSTIRQPLLFVHHVADACRTTSPGYAHALEASYPVIWVEGVDGAVGDTCGPYSAHGYLGREEGTVKAIADWIMQRRLVPKVDGTGQAASR